MDSSARWRVLRLRVGVRGPIWARRGVGTRRQKVPKQSALGGRRWRCYGPSAGRLPLWRCKSWRNKDVLSVGRGCQWGGWRSGAGEGRELAGRSRPELGRRGRKASDGHDDDVGGASLRATNSGRLARANVAFRSSNALAAFGWKKQVATPGLRLGHRLRFREPARGLVACLKQTAAPHVIE